MREKSIQDMDREELIKYGKTLQSKVTRRVNAIKRKGYASHNLDVLIARREEVLGDDYEGNYSSFSKKWTDSQLRATIKANEKFLKGKMSSVREIEKYIRDYSDVMELDGKITPQDKSEIVRYIDNANDSVNALTFILGSEPIGKLYKMVRNGDLSDSEVTYKLSKYYNEHKVQDMYLEDLEDMFGVDLS